MGNTNINYSKSYHFNNTCLLKDHLFNIGMQEKVKSPSNIVALKRRIHIFQQKEEQQITDFHDPNKTNTTFKNVKTLKHGQQSTSRT